MKKGVHECYLKGGKKRRKMSHVGRKRKSLPSTSIKPKHKVASPEF